MRMNYCGYSAVDAPISVVLGGKLVGGAQAGHVDGSRTVRRLMGRVLETARASCLSWNPPGGRSPPPPPFGWFPSPAFRRGGFATARPHILPCRQRAPRRTPVSRRAMTAGEGKSTRQLGSHSRRHPIFGPDQFPFSASNLAPCFSDDQSHNYFRLTGRITTAVRAVQARLSVWLGLFVYIGPSSFVFAEQ